MTKLQRLHNYVEEFNKKHSDYIINNETEFENECEFENIYDEVHYNLEWIIGLDFNIIIKDDEVNFTAEYGEYPNTFEAFNIDLQYLKEDNKYSELYIYIFEEYDFEEDD